MPPYSGAASLRGRSIVEALGRAIGRAAGLKSVVVYTTTPEPSRLEGVDVVTLPVAEVENAENLFRRVVGELRMGWVAGRQMVARVERNDLVLISSPAYITALMLSWWAWWRGARYILELRDVYPQVYAEAGLMGRDSTIYRFMDALSQSMYRHAELILAATEGLRREIAAAAGSVPVYRVYNGFPREFLTRRATKYSRFTVCFHGTMGFFQDIETLVALAGRLVAHEIDVVAIGYGRKAKLLEDARLPNLRFLGRLAFANTIAQIERCHVGLCLRRDDEISRDAFPVKIWEYLGLGLPSIVTPHCEAGEFLQERRCGIQLRAGDLESLLAGVLALRDRQADLQAMADRCRDVAAEYTRERMGDIVASHIMEVARRRISTI
jgi:glycosyltransferase involved in cell wall biosynthesis